MTKPKLEIALLTRQAMLQDAPDGLSGDALEIWRIARSEKSRLSIQASGEIPSRADMQKAGRSIPAIQRTVVGECNQAIEILRKHIAPKDMTTGQYWSFLLATEEDADRALEFLSSVVDQMKKRSWPLPKPGKPKEDIGMACLSHWPLLEHLGYSMRAASKILSAAFNEAGVISGDNSESIYQTIRNSLR